MSKRSTHSRQEDRLDIRILRAANRVFCRMYHKLEVLSACPIPREGPAILVCNHIGGLDPVFIQSVCNRVVTWMMAKEFYEMRGMHEVFRRIEAIPVERSGKDMPAARAGMRALSEGRVLGIFPEGRIEPNYDLMPFQTGVAMMAVRCRVPVFPAYIDGTQRGKQMLPGVSLRQEAKLRFGGQIDLGTDNNLASITERIRAAVEVLKRQTLTNSWGEAKNQAN